MKPRIRKYRIASIPGDGIGIEVIAEGEKVLRELAKKDGGFALEFTPFDWGSKRFLKTGAYMPEAALDILKKFDAIFFGAEIGRAHV